MDLAIKPLSIILAIVAGLLLILVASLTNLLRETNAKSACFSFSRVQLFFWTTTVVPIFCIHWGAIFEKDKNTGLVNTTSLILLGISSAVTFTSSVVSAVQLDAKRRLEGKHPLKAEGSSNGFWIDILTDDEGQFSIARVQQLVFTFVYIVIYITTFFDCIKLLPAFDNYAFVLMGISTGSYILGKSVNK